MMKRHLVAMFLLCAPLCACEEAPAPEGPPVLVIEGPDAAPDLVDPCAAGCALGFVNLPDEVSAALGGQGRFQVETRGGAGEVTFTVSERCVLTSSVEAGGLVRWSCPPLPEVCAISVQVRDEREATEIGVLTVRCEDQAPEITSSAPERAQEEIPYVYEVVCEDPEGQATQVFVSTEDTCGGVVVEGRYEWTPTEAQGGEECVVGVGCSDGVRSQGQTTRVAVIEEDHPPRFEGLPALITAELGVRVRHETGALDPEGGAVEVRVVESSCSFEPAVEGAALAFTCGGVERCDVRVQVSDGANMAEGVLSVRCGDTPPRFTEPRPAAAFEGERYVWPATCEDAEGDPVSVTLVSQDCGGLVFLGGEIRFTPGELMGGKRCEYVVRCASELAVTEERVMLEIRETNQLPRFGNLPITAIFRLNRVSTFLVDYRDDDYPAQELTMSLGSTTCAGVISRPSPSGVGYQCGAAAERCEVMVRVSDGEALVEARLTVSCQNSAPTVVGSVRISPSQLPTYSVPLQCLHSTQDPDGDPVTTLVEWLVDGVVVATGPTLAGYPHGARVRCRVTPSDGQLTGSPTTSAELVIPRRQGLAAGGEHTCVIKGDALHCWGANDRGQLGDGSTAGRFTPAPTLIAGATRGVAAGDAHTCAISAGALWCWGANDQGQLGDGTTADRATPTAVPGMDAGVTDVSAGAAHTCAVKAGALYCWGANTRGQLGDGTTVGSAVAVGVSGLAAGVEEVDAGGAHTCALKGGEAYCWGANDQGQLGDGTMVDRALSGAPVQSQVKLLKAGGAHTCAASATSVSCWGANDQGQLGDGTTVARATPALIVGGTQAVEALEVGARHGCIVRAGRGSCWGANERGQAGVAGWMPQLTPAAISGPLQSAARLSLGGAHSCLHVESSAGPLCWGDNMAGQLAVPGLEQQPRPRAVLNRANSYAVTAGARHTCGNQGTVGELCWGDNQHGQLGDGTTEERHVPLASTSSGGDVSAGAEHTCVGTTSTLRCWGRNQHGQLGLGDRVTRLTPQVVMLPTTPTRATTPLAGDGHTCAYTYGGVMRCWGDNSSGQLGDNSAVSLLAPGALLSVGINELPSAGGAHTCTISGGTLYCWGDNSRGQLGDGTTTSRLTPTAVAGMIGGVTRVSAGAAHTCAIKDQAVYCWGANDRGQVGDRTTQDRLTPTIIPSLSIDARYLDAGEGHTCATRSGQVYCWGANDRGQVGDGTVVDRSEPVGVFVSNLSSGLSAGEGHTCAARNSQLWCWGDNSHGQLGVGAERWWGPLTVTLP